MDVKAPTQTHRPLLLRPFLLFRLTLEVELTADRDALRVEQVEVKVDSLKLSRLRRGFGFARRCCVSSVAIDASGTICVMGDG